MRSPEPCWNPGESETPSDGSWVKMLPAMRSSNARHLGFDSSMTIPRSPGWWKYVTLYVPIIPTIFVGWIPIFFPWAISTGWTLKNWATALSGHHARLSDHMCSSLLEVLSMDWSEGKLENWLETTVLPSDCRKVSFDFVSLQPSLHTLIGYSSANMEILRPEKSSSGCFLIVVSMWTRWKTSLKTSITWILSAHQMLG